LSSSAQAPGSARAANTTGPDDLRSTKIVRESVDGQRCRQRIFDNQTGSFADTEQSCDNTPVMAHRLDGIAKSFSGQ
jgi:hypothetical protein